MPEPHHPSAEPGQIALQLLVVFALVLINGFFVASEFALVSVRRTRIDQLAAEGSGSAAVVQRALRDLDRYIAATQVGITLASLLLGGLGERALEPLLSSALWWMPESWQGISRVTVATFLAYFIMTALHVIIGELMPKSVALQFPDTVSLVVGRPMTLVARLFTPLTWMLNGTGNFLLRRLGIQSSEGHGQVHSPEELDLLFTQSHEGGELTETERDILHRVVRFSDLTAREVMVPRVEVKGLPVEISRGDLTALIHGQPHTRMPIYHGTLDEIVGIAHLKDLVRFAAALDGDGMVLQTDSSTRNDADMLNLMPLAREAARVPETITIDKMLVEFKRQRQQMAIVIDEYGGTSGLITMGDLLEQAFGDVHDEFDKPEPEIFTRPDGHIQMPGRTLIDEVNERFHTGFPDDESDTMAGLILGELGRPAAVGDEVEINGVQLCVEAIERLRITVISMQPPAIEEEAAARSNGASGGE